MGMGLQTRTSARKMLPMRIVLDDKPCSLQAGSVADAIDAAATLAEQAGRVIVDVFVDGDRWSGEQLGGKSTALVAPTEVRFVTAEPHELVRQTLLDASAALQDADDFQRAAAEQIQAGDLAGAMPRLGEAITIWQSVKQAVASGAELVGLDLQALQVEHRPAEQIISGLGEQLRSLKNSLAAGDAIGLADTLLYELPAVVDSWRGLLEQMHAAVGRPGPGEHDFPPRTEGVGRS